MIQRKLENLLKGVGGYELKGNLENVSIQDITIDSRNVVEGCLFAALVGSATDGHEYIPQAVQKGAEVIVCEEWPEAIERKVTYIKVENARWATGQIANQYFDEPSRKLKCVGITGTNGKTSIATMLYSLFKELGYKVGLISTIEILVNEKKWDTTLTTPDVISLHRLMSDMVAEGCSHVFMEVSSHAVDQKRIAGLSFTGGIFTNITHDHLDYHGDFSSYIRAKQLFFTGLEKTAFALSNIDDKNGEVMIQNSLARRFRYSLRQLTDFKSKVISEEDYGMYLEIGGFKFMTRMTGRFNAANLTAVYGATMLLEDLEQELVIEKISGLEAPKGRMEVVVQRPKVIVDYAHTPDALENVLKALAGHRKKGRLIVVVGCGGDRDEAKRPAMGSIAIAMSDYAVFTSDNPRSEDPGKIIDDMKTGLSRDEMSNMLEIEDRRSAIKTALTLANERDTVLIAGKGHEQYQEIKGKKHFFSDQLIVKDILSKDI